MIGSVFSSNECLKEFCLPLDSTDVYPHLVLSLLVYVFSLLSVVLYFMELPIVLLGYVADAYGTLIRNCSIF